MTLFYYDRSFEGLLSALFDAYSRRQFPDHIRGVGEPAPMFTDTIHEVVSDTVKAGRVWRGLEKKVPGYVCNMVMCVWLSEEVGSDELLFRFLRKIFDRPGGAFADFADDDILQIKKLAQKVAYEGQRMRMFVRFQKAADGTFFAPVSPVYNALPLSIEYFRDRFADQRWFIYDTRRRYGYAYDLHEVREVTLENDEDIIEGKLSDEQMAEDEKLFQSMWKTYHKAIAIKERTNPRLQRQFMPRRYWKYLTEMQ